MVDDGLSRAQRWRLRHPEKDKSYNASYNLKRKLRQLGVSHEQYLNKLKSQKGRCAICEQVSKRRLVIDHCHATNVMRGLLCDPCNKALGLFKDNPEVILRAANYLESVSA